MNDGVLLPAVIGGTAVGAGVVPALAARLMSSHPVAAAAAAGALVGGIPTAVLLWDDRSKTPAIVGGIVNAALVAGGAAAGAAIGGAGKRGHAALGASIGGVVGLGAAVLVDVLFVTGVISPGMGRN